MNRAAFYSSLLLASSLSFLHADVHMPAIFGDHMVLQQSVQLPLWGTADPGEKIIVTVGDSTGNAVAGADGKWMVWLKPVSGATTPVKVTVQGHNTLTFNDVLIGDVWVASGQSNMEFGLGNAYNGAEEIPLADHPLIRLFIVDKVASYVPLDEVRIDPKPTSLVGHWQVCTPDSVAKEGGWNGFSAVAYFFGKEIQAKTGGALGLVACSFGGKPVQSFVSMEAMKQNPEFAGYVAQFEKEKNAETALKAAYPAALDAYTKAKADWDKSDEGVAFSKAMADWKANQTTPKPKPPASMPVAPTNGAANPNTATTLYNGMIHPIIPFAAKGFIWYQGESNGGHPSDYCDLFTAMIQDWRLEWKEGNLPFLFVQLASYSGSGNATVEKGTYAALREHQLMTLKLPQTGMAVAIDIGEQKDIHPKDKLDVGHRLALAALALAYGEKIPFAGPYYDSMKVEGDKIRISFKNTDGGLKIAAHPKIRLDDKPVAPTSLPGFGIAGDDHKWADATAVIDGNTVVVSSDQVKNPVAVRYGWAGTPACYLYNGADLPASPFRTDNWSDAPAPTAPPVKTAATK
jgi:sialate O-acetylesterase